MEAPDWVGVFPIENGDIPAIAMLDYRSVDFSLVGGWTNPCEKC